MITQKGLKPTDTVVIVGENGSQATFSVPFKNCERFTKEISYISPNDLRSKLESDTKDFENSLATTIFTVEYDDDEDPVNDSWGSIMGDLYKGVRRKAAKLSR